MTVPVSFKKLETERQSGKKDLLRGMEELKWIYQ